MRTFKPIYKDSKGDKWIETKNWYCELPNHRGNVRRFPGYTDRDATETLGKQIQRLVSCRASTEPISPELSRWLGQIPSALRQRFVSIGLLDPEHAGGGKLLSAHIADFGSVIDKGNTGKHAKLVLSRVRRIVNGCKFITWADISASRA